MNKEAKIETLKEYIATLTAHLNTLLTTNDTKLDMLLELGFVVADGTFPENHFVLPTFKTFVFWVYCEQGCFTWGLADTKRDQNVFESEEFETLEECIDDWNKTKDCFRMKTIKGLVEFTTIVNVNEIDPDFETLLEREGLCVLKNIKWSME